MSGELVSVVMPVRDAGRYLAGAIASVLAQSHAPLEFLITDDGSTDRSPEILAHYARLDPRIRLVPRVGEGYLVALNEMVGRARGEFVARMDADDLSTPDRLGLQLAYLRARPSCLAAGSRVLVIDPDGDPLCLWNAETTHEEIDALHLDGSRGAVICHPSAMFRRRAMLEAGGYRDRFYSAEDLDLFLRLAERGRLANLPEVLLKYRLHPASVGQSQGARQRGAIAAAIAEARARRGLPPAPEAPPAAPRSPSEGRRAWGWWALAAGNRATARKHALAGVAEAPLSLASWRLLYCAMRGW